MGFEEPHLRSMVYLEEPGFPRISHISAYAAHQGGLVLWYGLGRPVITSEIGNWSVFVLLGWRLYSGLSWNETGESPTSSDAITTLGIIQLLLSYVF